MGKHTPGPWVADISPGRGTLCVLADSAWICGELLNNDEDLPMGDAEAWANARLIAAAPDMLAALKDVLESIEITGECLGNVQEIRAAIAKAEVQP